MARFETPIESTQVREALAGLDYQSVMIARSAQHSAKLQDFMNEFVTPEALACEMSDGEEHVYELPRVSAIGEDGSLLHIRLHEQDDDGVIHPSLRHLAAISHVNDPNPANIFTATSADTVRFDASRETQFTIGHPEVHDSLQVVESPMSQLEWEIELTLARERALRALPLVAINGNGWRYRRSDGHWERLRDVRDVFAEVNVALARGLGHAALPSGQAFEESTFGQNVEKMVV